MNTKICRKCKQEKTYDQLVPRKKCKNRVDVYCKKCAAEYTKKYSDTYRERVNEVSSECHKKNPRLEYYRQRNKNLSEERKEHKRHYIRTRRSQIANLETGFTIMDWINCLEFFNYKCAYCGCEPTTFHREHIIPTSKGGGFIVKNIIPSCHSCNSSKRNYDLIVWLKKKFKNYEKVVDNINKYLSTLN